MNTAYILAVYTILAIPVIIHLFIFRKTKKVFFTNVKAIYSTVNKLKSRNRLQHFLVLFLRLSLFGLLCFFITCIYNRQIEQASSSVIYLDNSYSMSNKSINGLSNLKEATSLIKLYIEAQDIDHEYSILTNDYEPFSNQFRSANDIKDYLSSITYTSRRRSINEILDRMISRSSMNSTFLIFSDFQKNSILNEMDVPNELILVPVQNSLQSNIFIDSVYLENPSFDLTGQNKIIFIVGNSGNNTREINFRLLEDNKLLGSQTLSILSSNENQLKFDFNLSENNIRELKLSFEDLIPY